LKISIALPDTILTNHDLELGFNDPRWTAEKIYSKTGIESRHIACKETVSDLAVQASQNLINEHSLDIKCIDFVLLCTQSPDYSLPTTACLIQHRLGLSNNIGALDFNLGCSGFVYGLSLAQGLLLAGACSNILLIMAETYSKYINFNDKSTRTIFGDGASALHLTRKSVNNIGKFVFGTDGSGFNHLIVPSGGGAIPHSSETRIESSDEAGNIRSLENLYMNGPEIFSFTIRTVPELIFSTLDRNSLTIDDVDLFVFHQANAFLLENLRLKIGIPKEKFYVNLKFCGNTVSASIPIALYHAIKAGKIKSNYTVLIAGFGVGYSWGATIVHFSDI